MFLCFNLFPTILCNMRPANFIFATTSSGMSSTYIYPKIADVSNFEKQGMLETLGIIVRSPRLNEDL